jgi:hypothetical protein
MTVYSTRPYGRSPALLPQSFSDVEDSDDWFELQAGKEESAIQQARSMCLKEVRHG